MSNCPPQNDPCSHLEQIRSIIAYFQMTPVKHFDVHERHSMSKLSKFSELHGAINFPTSGILRVTPEGLYLIQTSTTNDIFTTIHPGEANRDDEDIQFAYLNRDGKDRKFEFLCQGQCTDGTSRNRLVSFDSCAGHLDRYHDTSSSKDIQCPWCGSRKNLARHYQDVHLGFPRWRRP